MGGAPGATVGREERQGGVGLEQALLRAERTGTLTAVIFVDLDHFKQINDTLGHFTGDIVLCLVAAVLRTVVRSPDTVARIGGDEFVVVCPDLRGYADAFDLGRRIVAHIGGIADSCDHAAGLTASVGVSVGSKGRSSAETMLLEADAAMYRAKALGETGPKPWSQARNGAVTADRSGWVSEGAILGYY